MNTHVGQTRQRYGGYKTAEDLNDLLAGIEADSTTLDTRLAALSGSISSLHTLTYGYEMARLWGEPPFTGQLSSVSTTSTLLLCHNSTGNWVAWSLLNRVTFPSVTQATVYSVFNTLATVFAVPTVDKDALYTLLAVNDHYRIERVDPTIGDVQYLRYSVT